MFSHYGPKCGPHGYLLSFDWVVGCSYVGLPEYCDIVRNPIGANVDYAELSWLSRPEASIQPLGESAIARQAVKRPNWRFD